MSLSLLFQAAPVQAEEMSIAFPASADPEIRQAQQTMVESWAYVQALYLDPSFSHTDWTQALQDSLAASFKARSAAEVADITNQLLGKLGDPYTRLLQGDDATALEAQEEGKIVASGLGLQQEALLVSFVVDDSAAAAAGVTEGDLLLSVDGQPVVGQELRQIYKLLSKEADVTLLRQPPGSSSSSASSSSIQLMPQLNDRLIVDLRDNPGGIVEAGVSIAQDFLQEGQVLCIALDKSGQEERVVLPTAHTLTQLPLVLLLLLLQVVLVNGFTASTSELLAGASHDELLLLLLLLQVVLVNRSTASTSELLAGALHDELSAPLIGTTTYGKGRSQRVVQLADGTSTLLVSTLKYFTPQHTEIDKVGLKPDLVCDPPEVVGGKWTGGRVDGEGEGRLLLLDDPCVKLAAEKLTARTL
ncbi:hypothetical protein OEZ85_004545 [Tetradesmus obliquus]|uniref:PDZ domain-containing protein n=1 Tax=Tetradesmus obliquus TaxID=3088 RepID=A0ABY8ULQ2_TETOB|nr:hypothetical protein OEZ85_004545 [Tetradesmus obliquus]